MKMKKFVSVVLVLTLALALAACGGEAAATKMTMGTGGTTGTYYAFGGVLGQYITNHGGVAVNVVSTDGSKANIEGIHAGDYQLATVQSDVMAYAWAGSRSSPYQLAGAAYAYEYSLYCITDHSRLKAETTVNFFR